MNSNLIYFVNKNIMKEKNKWWFLKPTHFTETNLLVGVWLYWLKFSKGFDGEFDSTQEYKHNVYSDPLLPAPLPLKWTKTIAQEGWNYLDLVKSHTEIDWDPNTKREGWKNIWIDHNNDLNPKTKLKDQQINLNKKGNSIAPIIHGRSL